MLPKTLTVIPKADSSVATSHVSTTYTAPIITVTSDYDETQTEEIDLDSRSSCMMSYISPDVNSKHTKLSFSDVELEQMVSVSQYQADKSLAPEVSASFSRNFLCKLVSMSIVILVVLLPHAVYKCSFLVLDSNALLDTQNYYLSVVYFGTKWLRLCYCAISPIISITCNTTLKNKIALV